MARENKLSTWLENNSTEDFLRRWNLDASSREALWAEVGYANEGACYNAARNAGIIAGGPIKNGGDGERKARSCKVSLPIKTAMAICRALGKDPEDYDTIVYDDYCLALDEQGDAWRDMLYTRLGGLESDGGKALFAWVYYHVQAELEAQRKRERESDPTYQLKVKLANAQDATRIANDKVADLEKRIGELEQELRQARAMSGPKRFTGGVLTVEMKRLMAQRFHPDKQNGNSEELYTAIIQWINALETVD